MNMQTPRSYDKKSNYTSPIGLLKNFNTLNATNNNSVYEQQFYKIKAQRLQAELQQLKQENSMLKAKTTDLSAANQTLRQKIFVFQNTIDRVQRNYTHRTIPSFVTDSGYPSGNNSGRESPSTEKYFSLSIPNDRSERSAFNSEIQRLVKQNRILKNEHQVEMTKVRDENKKLARRILQLSTQSVKKPNDNQIDIEQKAYRQKQDERMLKIEKTNYELRKENEQFEKQNKKLQQRLRLAQETNRGIKKQNEQLKIIQSSKFRSASNIQEELNSKMDRKEKQHQEQVRVLKQQINQLKNNKNIHIVQTEGLKQNKSNAVLQSVQAHRSQKQNENLKRKISILQQNLNEKQQQIKNILIKLKPLIQKQKQVKRNEQDPTKDSNRASLSLLEVFLKKYKINSF